MKHHKRLSNLLLALGTILAAVAVCIALSAKNDAPKMLQYPADAMTCAQEMVSRLEKGDYAGASQKMYGRPALGAAPDSANVAVELLWTEFLGSMDFAISDKCYVTDTGVAVDATVRMLDVPAVISSMEHYARELLGRRVAAAKDMSEIYDSDNNFRQDIMDKVLRDATMQALSENTLVCQENITLNLIYEKGQWWVVPDAQLQSILSGGF